MYRTPKPGDLLLYEPPSYKYAPLAVIVLSVWPRHDTNLPGAWPPVASQVEVLVLLPDGRKRVVHGTKLRVP